MSRRALEKKVENEIFAKQAKTVEEFLKKNNASKVAACQMKESEAETEVYAREKAREKARETINDDEYEKVYKQIFSQRYFRTLEGVYQAAYEEAVDREYIDTCYVRYPPTTTAATAKTPSPDRMDWQRTPSSGNLDNRVVPLRQFSGDIGSGSNPLRQFSGDIGSGSNSLRQFSGDIGSSSNPLRQFSGGFSPRKIKRKSPSRKSPKRKSQLPCRPDQVRNRSTGRCRKKSSVRKSPKRKSPKSKSPKRKSR